LAQSAATLASIVRRRIALASLAAGVVSPWPARASLASLPRLAEVPGGVAIVDLGAAALRPTSPLEDRFLATRPIR
jgi:hypothetical protein